jgi:hypothetical protein
LELRSAGTATRAKLLLTFFGVRNLTLRQSRLSELRIGTLRVDSIRDRQWEGLNYRVVDDEDEVLSLLCLDFDAVYVE